MKKLLHVLVLAVFGFGCIFVWGILKLAPAPLIRRTDLTLPAFTTLCVGLRPPRFDHIRDYASHHWYFWLGLFLGAVLLWVGTRWHPTKSIHSTPR